MMSKDTHPLHIKIMSHALKHFRPLALVLRMMKGAGKGRKGGKGKAEGKCRVAEAGAAEDGSPPSAGQQVKGCATPGSRCEKVLTSLASRNDNSEDAKNKTFDGRRCATDGCQYKATKGDHCCGACAKGKRCGHGRQCQQIVFNAEQVASAMDSTEDSDNLAEEGKRCATEGCQYEATKGDYCCGACAKGKRCGHGKHCKHVVFVGIDAKTKKSDFKPCAAPGCTYQAGRASSLP